MQDALQRAADRGPMFPEALDDGVDAGAVERELLLRLVAEVCDHLRAHHRRVPLEGMQIAPA